MSFTFNWKLAYRRTHEEKRGRKIEKLRSKWMKQITS
jgi:hypothetical protein